MVGDIDSKRFLNQSFIKDPIFRRFISWALPITIVFIYILGFNVLLKDMDFWSLNLILYGVTLLVTLFVAAFSYMFFKPKCVVCQKTEKELTQPKNADLSVQNTIFEYCYSNIFLCDGCLVRSYYAIPGIKGRIEQIQKIGLINFYRDREDNPIDINKIKPKQI